MEMFGFATQLLCILVFCTVRINGIKNRDPLVQNQDAKFADCGGVFNVVPGTIKHPNSSERYGSNELCMWSIGSDVPLLFSFSKFNTETQFDYVTVRDGGSIGSPEIGIYSGKSLNEVPQTFTTTGAALVTFNSDENVVGQGFILNWRIYTAEDQCEENLGTCLRTGDKCNGTIAIIENSCVDKCVCCKGPKVKAKILGIIALIGTIQTIVSVTGVVAGVVYHGAIITTALLIADSFTNYHHRRYNRWMEMTVENKSKWVLRYPKTFKWYGFISSPPWTTDSCKASQLAGHKRGHNATGITGIVSYYLRKGNGMHVLVYYSVSYSGCNALGLGIYRDLNWWEPRDKDKYDYFYDFYYYHENYYENGYNHAKTIAYRTVCNNLDGAFCTRNLGLKVCGIMDKNSGAGILISVQDESSSQC